MQQVQAKYGLCLVNAIKQDLGEPTIGNPLHALGVGSKGIGPGYGVVREDPFSGF